MSITKLCEEITAALAARPVHELHQDARAGWCASLVEHVRKRAIAKGKKDIPSAAVDVRDRARE